MQRLFLGLVTLLLLARAAGADPAPGVVGRALPQQVGVFVLQVEDTNEFKPGDVVKVYRAGQCQGEAVVLPSDGRILRISTRGSTEARPGDEVRFSRHPKLASALPAPAPGPTGAPAGQGAPGPEEPAPARLEVSRPEVFVASFGRINVTVRVRNAGGKRSNYDTLECRWTAFGQNPVVDTTSIPSLEPGEARAFTI